MPRRIDFSSQDTLSLNRDPEIVIKSDEKEADEYLVVFDGTDDQEDASRLSRLHKWAIVTIISFGSLCVTCISSSWSLASSHIMEHFHISHEVSVLGISFFILGLGTGGIFLSPISEFHGRKMVYILGLSVMIAFEFLTAFSENIGSVIFGRFMSGFFGSSFMSVASGSFSDLFKSRKSEGKDANKELALALVLYSASPFVGPGIGPLLSGFINTKLNFRWTFYVLLMWSGLLLVLVILFVPETYEPINLKRKAKRLRKQTGNNRLYAAIERSKVTLRESVLTSSKRPILLLCRDNMTLVLCFYTGFTLAIVYLFFVAFPYIFVTVYNFSLAEQGMSFLGLITAWTSYPHVHWIAPIIGSAVYGAGTILVFNGIFSYTVEAYRLYAASSMAANSFVRSVMSAVFPLFGLQMYQRLGIQWATSLLAWVACALIPIPFIFFKYGPRLRAQSPYAWSIDT
ncbi:hypothetical protein KGF56_002987 [Candida oxycetoniae]|uniref:Major facilitator superfamily (MFS) profile domain-containing protein n=1 Tax=Candida oxycetoniae TaxID=497107 RepID=A0AAI9SW69_9ASCO|nr:uncharacterized protein KGF56_002987 [Candida oxycetoniae]KAI3404226.2 hypothetical protein KGF56_002987 [Candida oxycetoniae]